MISVKKLCLDNTGICSLAPSVGKMKNLEALSLEHNSLTDLPITLEFCQNLTMLNLKDNKFVSIPGVVLKLKNLKELRHSCTSHVELWEQSVLDMPPKQSRCIVNHTGPLQSMCMAAVFENHIDYLRQEAGCPKQCQVMLDHFASHVVICHMCSKLVSRGKV